MHYDIRYFWAGLVILIGAACQPSRTVPTPAAATPSPRMTVVGQREYHVRQQLTLVNKGSGQPEKQNLWVALIHDLLPYQQVQSVEVVPKDYQPVTDEYGNTYAEFDFSEHPAGTTITVQIDYRVVVNELTYDLSVCEGELPDEFVQPELHIEAANPQIVKLAQDLSKGQKTVCQQVRAFYDYIGRELVYGFNEQNWGAQATLGLMGADCTEYTSLLMALSRSQGIPARYFGGLLYLESETKSLARLEHVWGDVYMPGIGWVSIDPTLGRAPIYRETYFAHHTPEHIIVTTGVNPSTLRGGNYWTHLYWPGDSTKIRVTGNWEIERVGDEGN
jgi:transglutaminase-like putative cysteine protease